MIGVTRYPVVTRLSNDGLTLNVQEDDINSPSRLEEITVEVLPNGLGSAMGIYTTTATLATLPAPNPFDPIVSNVELVSIPDMPIQWNITIDSQQQSASPFVLSSLSTRDIIESIIFRDKSGNIIDYQFTEEFTADPDFSASNNQGRQIEYRLNLPPED